MPFPPVGGGHKRTLRLLEAMDRAGAVPHIVTDDGRSPEGAAELRGRGWSVDVVGAARPTLSSRARQHLRRLPSPYLGAVADRLGEVMREGCAFVQIEHTQSAYYPRVLQPARTVLSVHNVDSELLRSVARHERPFTLGWARAWSRWQATRAVERQALPRADAVLCVSAADREHLQREARRVLLVPNGVDDDLFDIGDEPPGGEDMLFFGRLDYAPNAHGVARFLREGWPEVIAARPDARLRIAGGGLGGELAALVAGTDGVEALGFVPDLRAELARCRLCLVPLWQGGGTRLKVLESLAAARPVAGTPLGVEQVGFEHERHGLVADSPADLARACVALLEDPERARRMGREGRVLAEGFRWERVTAPAETLYREWVEASVGAWSPPAARSD
jgi:polysaccharide biosynthesis protein PslH